MARHKWDPPVVFSGTRICKKCGCRIETFVKNIYGTTREKKTRWFLDPHGNARLLAWDTPMPPCDPRDGNDGTEG